MDLYTCVTANYPGGGFVAFDLKNPTVFDTALVRDTLRLLGAQQWQVEARYIAPDTAKDHCTPYGEPKSANPRPECEICEEHIQQVAFTVGEVPGQTVFTRAPYLEPLTK